MSVTNLTINELGPKGDGIHFGSEENVYVERAIPGDHILARVQRDFKGVPRAEILEILQPSPYRQRPPCPHYQACGNCTLQHLNFDFYADWKVQTVVDAFQRQGLEPKEWQETFFISGNSRRRATFSARKDRGSVSFGYYRRRSQFIADIDSCLIADPKLFTLRDAIKPFLGTLLKEGTTADIFLQLVGENTDMVITGPVGRNGSPDEAMEEVLEGILYATGVTRIGWRMDSEQAIEPILNKGPVSAQFGSLKVDLPAAAFLQPTAEGEKALTAAIMRWLPKSGKFADLFSGSGTFTGPMLERGSVDAYDFVEPAIAALTKAGINKPLKAIHRDLTTNPLKREELDQYDAVIFDPPRAGCEAQAKAMKKAKTPVLIGVSCNPATFARDASRICENGYQLRSLQIIDQFLWSHHVEMVGVFTR